MGRDVEIGRIEGDEFADFRRLFNLTFGLSGNEEELARVRPWHELDRSVAARADGQLVATSGAYTFDLALPGADPVGCAGVTVVSVRGDHRRRGVLTRMMRQLFEDADDRGEPFAALWASEAPIYGRFGFGPAAPTNGIEVPSSARLRAPVDTTEVRFVDAATAKAKFPAIHQQVRRTRPGMLGLSDAWWDRVLEDDPAHRDGAGQWRYALLDDRGYAMYRLKSDWEDGLPTGTAQVKDLLATDPEAHATLWQFVLDTDLASRTKVQRWAVDEPLPLLLDNEGLVRISADWPFHVCLVDLPVALAARGYLIDDALTLRVHDPFQARNDGTWRLSVIDGKAACERADGDADLELPADVLGALCLGGQRATRYAAAGRIEVHRADAPGRLDRLFATELAPWHHVMF